LKALPSTNDNRAAGPAVVGFARIWNATHKSVFSNTLE
jgi:hypothetical protein